MKHPNPNPNYNFPPKFSGYDNRKAPPKFKPNQGTFFFTLLVPQAPEHNRGVWAKSVEPATRNYARRASGDVYVITGPAYVPSIALSPGIGAGQVRVPKYLFKLVYDQDQNRAWAYWQENSDATRASKPISYAELVKRTGVDYLSGVHPN